MRRLLGALTAALAIFVTPMANAATQTSVARAMEATVIVHGTEEVPDLDTGTVERRDMDYCSGFVGAQAGKTLYGIITARHCVQDGVTPHYVRFFDGDLGKVGRIQASKTADVAMMWVQTMRSHQLLRSDVNLPNPGDPLFVIGMPAGDPWSYSDATSRNGQHITSSILDGGPEATLNCPGCYEGDSGGPVLNADGVVVGVLNMSMWNGGTLLYFEMVPTREVFKLESSL